jgi:hypothetical protein
MNLVQKMERFTGLDNWTEAVESCRVFIAAWIFQKSLALIGQQDSEPSDSDSEELESKESTIADTPVQVGSKQGVETRANNDQTCSII